MAQDMTYAQALTEAKHTIVQQQYRIKADAEKVKAQQQTILDQSAALSEHDRRIREQGTELQRLVEELDALNTRLVETTVAKEQADAVVDRQGQRLTGLQAANAELERRSAEQLAQVHALTTERDALLTRLPTKEDADALAAMNELLGKRTAALAAKAGPALRLADESGESPADASTPAPGHAQAA